MRKPLPEIQENIPELEEMLKAEKRIRQKQRIQMLYLLRSGQADTRIKASEMLAVNRATIGGLAADIRERRSFWSVKHEDQI